MPRAFFVKTPGLRKGRVQLSKRVIDRLKAARDLRGSIEAFSDDAVAGFSQQLEAELRDGETMPDQALSLQLMARWTTTASEQLRQREYAYCKEGSRRVGLRKRCKKAARKLYPRMVNLRRLIDSTFGKEAGFEVHGLAGKTRRKPQRLYDQTTLMMERLRDPHFELPAPLIEHHLVDRDDWLGLVEAGFDELETLLGELSTLELDEVGARDLRDLALDAFDEVYGKALAYIKAVFAVAGYHERIARVLKPYAERRRLSRKARQERQARAEGKRQRVPGRIRAAVSTVTGWLGGRVA